jgi:hypothetical protein
LLVEAVAERPAQSFMVPGEVVREATAVQLLVKIPAAVFLRNLE